jgi:hypothetical protein
VLPHTVTSPGPLSGSTALVSSQANKYEGAANQWLGLEEGQVFLEEGNGEWAGSNFLLMTTVLNTLCSAGYTTGVL